MVCILTNIRGKKKCVFLFAFLQKVYVSYGQRPFFGQNLKYNTMENWKQEEIAVEFINDSGDWDTAYYYIWVDDETETNELDK